MSLAVVKVGTSSITDDSGVLDDAALLKLCGDLAAARRAGPRRGARAVGRDRGGHAGTRARSPPHSTSARCRRSPRSGQPRLLERLNAMFSTHGVVAGQVLLTPYDFIHRSQYLHARETLRRLLDLGVLPVVNENDTVADDEIRFGDNDRLAALVSHLLRADILVLLTDTEGVFTADPRRSDDASLIEEIVEVDAALESVAGGAGTARGSGGMASKLAAAKIAAWSGVRAVIAAAAAPGVVVEAIAGRSVGTSFAPRPHRLSSRKLWIAFAQGAAGRVVVDDGARARSSSATVRCSPPASAAVEGEFAADDPVEVVDEHGRAFAKGLSRYRRAALRTVAGSTPATFPTALPHEVVHRDDLVVLP